MKKLLLCIIILFFFGTTQVYASTQALDLNEVLELAEIEKDYDDYKEDKKQVTIYFFMSKTCDHCHEVLKYINSITEEYGEKFKVRAFECSLNGDNNALHSEVVKFLKLKDKEGRYKMGVPLLIIGENTFYGFEESKEKIITAIENEYKKEKRYDLFDAMEKKEEEKNPNDALYILIPVLAIIIVYVSIKLFKKEKTS